MRTFFIIFLSVFAFANSAIAKVPSHVGEELRAVVEASLPSGSEIDLDDMMQIETVAQFVKDQNLDTEILQQAEIQIKYAGYIEKEKNNADKLNRLEGIKIPENFDYTRLKSLSFEAMEKLKAIQPATVSQASRISGVSPNDISVLLVYMGR